MTDIEELIKVVTNHRVRSIDVFDEERRAKKDKYTKMFNGIWKGQFESNSLAAKKLYDTSAFSSSYKTLKSRLKDKLQDTVMHVEPKGRSEFENVKYRCHKEIFIAKNLKLHGAHINVQDVLSGTYRNAQRYYLSDVLYEVTKLLRDHYMREGDVKEVEKMDSECKTHLDHLQAIDRCRSVHDRLKAVQNKGKGLGNSDFKKAAAGLTQLKTYLNDVKDFDFHFYYLRTQLAIQRNQKDFKAGLQTVRQMEEYLDAHSQFEGAEVRQEINCHHIELLLDLGELDACLVKVKEGLSLVKDGGTAYFELLRLEFLIHMHKADHSRATDTFQRVYKNKRFTEQPEEVKEQWYIFEGYLFLLQLSKGGGEAASKHTPNFKSKYLLDKFLSLTPVYSKHKRRKNASLLILQMLIYLYNGKKGNFEQRLTALREYKNRHSLKQRVPRLFQVTRLMEAFAKYGYEPERIKEGGEKYIKALSSARPNLRHGNFTSMEIIPYPALLAIALEFAEKR